MYNFKAIDYRLSNQEYVFSLLSARDEDRYDFIYVPYSEFPALLMLDYILATNPHEFNASVFEFFSEISETEKCGNNDILIVTEELSERIGFVNRLGVYKKDSYLSQVHRVKLARKQTNVEGLILNIGAGEGKNRDIVLIEHLNTYKKVLNADILDTNILARDKELVSNIIQDKIKGNRHKVIKSELLDAYTIYKDILGAEVLYNESLTLLDKRYGYISSVGSYNNGDRSAKMLSSMDGTNEGDRHGTIIIGDIVTRTLNSSESIILSGRELTKGYLNVSKYEAVISAQREYKLEGIINNFTIGRRYSYILGEMSYRELFAETPKEVKGRLHSLYEMNKQQLSHVEYLHERVYKEVNSELARAVNFRRVGVEDGCIVYPSTPYNKVDRSIIVENLITSEEKQERDAELTFLYDGDNELVSGGYLLDYMPFDYLEGRKFAFVHYADSSVKEKDYLGEINCHILMDNEINSTVNRGSYTAIKSGVGSHIGNYYISGINTKVRDTILIDLGRGVRGSSRDSIILFEDFTDKEKEKDTILFNLDVGSRDTSRASIVFFTELVDKEKDVIINSLGNGIRDNRRDSVMFFMEFTDKEKEATLEINLWTDKEKDAHTIDLYNYVREFIPKGYLKYDTDYIIERQGDGVVEYAISPARELGFTAVIDLLDHLTDYGEGKDAVALEGIGVSYRELLGGGAVCEYLFSGYREISNHGVLEFTIDAVKPRKKLIKSWLTEYERDKKKEMYLELYVEANRDKRKDLIKYAPSQFIRDVKKDLVVKYDLAYGSISQENKLDKSSEVYAVGNISSLEKMGKTNLMHGVRDVKEHLLKFNLEEYDYGKDAAIEYPKYLERFQNAAIEYPKYLERFQNAVIEEQVDSQGLLYNYFDILDEGMDVEHWKVGYAIPEHYDPLDPFNPYYPWAEERNTHSIIQEEEWEHTKGVWKFDKGNAVIESSEEGGVLTTKKPYGDFKFKFNTRLGYEPDCRSGFIFNYVDPDNYFKITISPGNNPIELVQLIGGRERKVASPIAPFYMDGGSWHNIDVSYVDDKLVVYVDGRLQYDLVLEY